MSLSRVFVDGTKIHPNSNRYWFVWAKSLRTYRAKLTKELEELWEYAQEVDGLEMNQESTPDFVEVNSEQFQQTVEKIDRALKGKSIESSMKTKLSKAKKECPERMVSYEQQEELRAGAESDENWPPNPAEAGQ